jgi:glutaryl-CoA dehydrogenase (non-decarboxylating)
VAGYLSRKIGKGFYTIIKIEILLGDIFAEAITNWRRQIPMDFNMPEELKILQKSLRNFAKKEIVPRVKEDERGHRFQKEIVRKMGEMGFLGCPIPEEYGGAQMGYLAHAICTEEIARVSGSLRAAFNMQTMGTALEIYKFGNEDQRRKYIPKLVKGELLGCVGITEPEAGTDTAAMKSKAIKEGDFYILDAQKLGSHGVALLT